MKYDWEICMDVYNGEQKTSRCKCPYRSDANILAYLWNETIAGMPGEKP